MASSIADSYCYSSSYVDDNNWTSGDNWIGDVAPIGSGLESVIFTGSVRTSPVNDFAANDAFLDITFDSSAVELGDVDNTT